MSLIEYLRSIVKSSIEQLYGSVDDSMIQLRETRKDFEGDITLVVFPLLKLSRKNPTQTAEEIAGVLQSEHVEVVGTSVVQGFLNISISECVLLKLFNQALARHEYGFINPSDDSPAVMLEFSSPNTNKPLHLGHIRNNLLGESISRILRAAGKKVIKVNLINDRGIHICKSMLAWQLYGNGETPQDTGEKGDHFVGRYYVIFDKKNKEEAEKLIIEGLDKDTAYQATSLMEQAREMLRKWETGDEEVRKLWQTMNSWVYDGFDKTYKRLGVEFDKEYYESDTYLLGKQMVRDALGSGLLNEKDDGSVWADLTDEGLDEKLLLRSDGTSVYITQDLGTAKLRYDSFKPSKMIYVVGNEQNYHFEVLKKLLIKLNFSWGESVYHLSYGMVELPEGKMKSREGTVVDADDLMQQMYDKAHEISSELSKLPDDEKKVYELCEMIGIGAIKYYILKVSPVKNMLFNPEESIDFNGNTAAFIQYTHARICSLLAKASEEVECGSAGLVSVQTGLTIKPVEREIIIQILNYSSVVADAANELSPSLIANYTYELAKIYNQFYQEVTVLKENDEDLRYFRLQLSVMVATLLKQSMALLGIRVPDKM